MELPRRTIGGRRGFDRRKQTEEVDDVTATVGQHAQAAARANDVWKVYGSGEAQVIDRKSVV